MMEEDQPSGAQTRTEWPPQLAGALVQLPFLLAELWTSHRDIWGAASNSGVK